MPRGVALGGYGLAMATVLCAAQPALAKDAKDGDDAAILVSATHRESPLSLTPIAVTVVSAETARAANVSDIRQLGQVVSSLFVYSTGFDTNAVARIRGVGTVGDNPGLESSVALFVDGVYRPRIGAGLTELGEIDRIEVLRGPQGTLFGRNSSAGLISIATKAPESTWGGSGEITHGNYDLWRLGARITGPVAEGVAFSLEGMSVKRDGYLHLIDPVGNRIGSTNDRDRFLLRGQLLLEPSDRLSVRLIGDYTHRDESCCGAVYLDTGEETGNAASNATTRQTNRIVTLLQSLDATFPNGTSPYAQDRRGRNISLTPGRLPVSKMRDWGLSATFDLTLPGDTKLTGITAWRDYWSADYGDQDYSSADLLYRDPGTYREFKTFSQELRARGKALGGRLDWLAGAYYAHEDLVLRDDLRFGEDYGAFAACRLMAGTAANPSPLLAFAPDCANPAALSAISAQFRSGGLPSSVTDVLGRGLATLGSITGGGDIDSRYRQKSDSIAVFTHDIVHLTRRVDLTLGLRYTHETKSVSATFANDNAACPVLQGSGLPAMAANPALGQASTLAGGVLALGCLGNSSSGLNALKLADRISDEQLSGTAILSWRPTERLMVYASFTHGTKIGGYNLDRFALGVNGVSPHVTPITFFTPRTNSDAASLRFGAETVDAFEIGAKIGGARWNAALALFQESFSNFQLNTFNGTGFIVQNINGCSTGLVAGTCAAGHVTPGLVSQGFELEIGVLPARHFEARASLTYADARFADRLVGSGDGHIALDPALFLLPGKRMFNAPDIVMTTGVSWTPPLGSSGMNALVHVDGRLVADTNAGADLYPEKVQDGYFLLGARIGLRGPRGRWTVEVWGQNLLNTSYSQVVFNTPLQSTGPNNQSVAQLGATSMLSNQLFSGFIGEPRTYGLTLRWKV